MLRTLDASMLNLPYSLKELAPLAKAAGFQALSAQGSNIHVLDDENERREAAALMRDLGLGWGLMPMTADFYHWALDDENFEAALERLRRRAEVARELGVTHAYNHVWPTSPRPFDENFEWTVQRVRRVGSVMRDAGVRYGLEFLGPHELRTLQPHEFVHSLSGVLAIADAADAEVGIAFDTYHWYCSNNGAQDDLMWMAQHTDRLVAVHMNDAPAGIPWNEQKDMRRCLPLETGVIDARRILNVLRSHPNDAPYMVEPFEPHCSRLHALPAEDAVKEIGAIFDRIEA